MSQEQIQSVELTDDQLEDVAGGARTRINHSNLNGDRFNVSRGGELDLNRDVVTNSTFNIS